MPDNPKSGVHKASFYDPGSTGATDDGLALWCRRLPARPRRPKDKSKVENGVRFAQTCILGRLRRETFFSLADANVAIAGALDRINDHVVRRLGVTRRHLFETIERRVLAPLPGDEYEFAEWRLARVGVDYHVEYDGFFYSVPHGLIQAQVDLRATSRTIELFHRGQRVALHQRRYGGRRHGTVAHGTDPITCPVRTAATRTGRRTASAAGRPRWAEHKPWSRPSWPIAPIPAVSEPALGVLRLFRDLEVTRAEAISARSLRIGALTLQEHRFHPRQPPGPPTRHGRARGCHRSRQPAWPQPLPLRRTTMLAHPTLDLLANLGLHGMLKGFQDLEANRRQRAWSMANGSLCCSTGR